MKTVKKYIQLIGLVLFIAILYHVRLEWMMPYILPVTIVGVIAILLTTMVICKQRGWMALLLLSFTSITMPVTNAHAYNLVNCGGQHTGVSTIQLFLEGKIVEGGTQAIQDAYLGGNQFTNDFDSKQVLACVIVNMVNAGEEIQNAPMDGKTCDPRLRNNAFYFMDNYVRMSANKATDNTDRGWIEREIAKFDDPAITAALQASQKIDKDAKKLVGKVKEYVKYCAEIDQREERNCRTVAQTIAKNSKDCWVCGIVESMLFAIQRVAVFSNILLLKFSLALLAVIFLFWIAVKVIQLIGTLGYDDYGSFFGEFLIRVMTVSIAAALLHAPIVDFYGLVVSPFIKVSAAFANSLSEMAFEGGGESLYDKIRKDGGFGINNLSDTDPHKNCLVYCQNMEKDDFKYSKEQLDMMGGMAILDGGTFNGLMCLSCRASNQVTPFIAIGERFSCYANANAFNIPFTDIYIPDIMALLFGYSYILAFSIISVVVSFYIIDAILKLAFVIILTPLLITAWAFPISRMYATRGWNLILYSLFQFIGLAVMMSLFMVLFMNLFSALPGVGGTVEMQLINAMKADDVEKLYKILTEHGYFVITFKLILAVSIGVKMIEGINACVENLSDISPGIPGIASEALKGMVQAGVGIALTAAGVSGASAAKAVKGGFKKASNIFKARNSTKGRFKGDGPTNTEQAVATKLKGFSDKSRQAGSKVGAIGKETQQAGQAQAERGSNNVQAGKERMAKGGLINRVAGAAQVAKGRAQQAMGKVREKVGGGVNAVTSKIGGGMNKAGNMVANASDKVANVAQNIGDKHQHAKEAALRSDPKAAAMREKGNNRLAQGFDRMSKGGAANIIKGGFTAMVGATGLALAKGRVGVGTAKHIKNRMVRTIKRGRERT